MCFKIQVMAILLLLSIKSFPSLPERGMETPRIQFCMKNPSQESRREKPFKWSNKLAGTWQGEKEILSFEKDTLYAYTVNKSEEVAFRTDKKDSFGKIYLEFEFYGKILEMPFAIYRIENDTLLLRRAPFESVRIEDYQYIPFPTDFNENTRKYIRKR